MQSKTETKKSSSKDNILDKFLSAIRLTYSDMDISRTSWPATAPQIEAYFSDIIATTIFNKFKENYKKCEEALNTLSVFTLYASLYHTEITGLKVGKIFNGYPASKKEIVDFTLFIFNIIRKRIQGKIFCLDKTHKILPEKEIKNLEKKLKWTEAKNQAIKKEISILIISLENLIWSLYFDSFTCTGCERQGPYFVNHNKIILIRNYFNLNPKEIWPIKNKYQSVRMYLKYPQNTGIKLDYGNHIKSSKPLQNKLISFSIIANKKQITALSEIRSLSEYFSRLAKNQAEKVNKLSPLEIIKKGTKIYYYRYKNFFDYYEEDWQPSQQVYDRIDDLKLRWWNYYRSDRSKKKSPEYYVKLFDPRNDFIG